MQDIIRNNSPHTVARVLYDNFGHLASSKYSVGEENAASHEGQVPIARTRNNGGTRLLRIKSAGEAKSGPKT